MPPESLFYFNDTSALAASPFPRAELVGLYILVVFAHWVAILVVLLQEILRVAFWLMERSYSVVKYSPKKQLLELKRRLKRLKYDF